MPAKTKATTPRTRKSPAKYAGMAQLIGISDTKDVRMMSELNKGLGKLCKGAGELGEVFYQGSAALTEGLKALRGDLYWSGIQDLMKKGLTEEEAVEYTAAL